MGGDGHTHHWWSKFITAILIANAGVPMITLQLPAMIVALAPIVLLEGVLSRRLLSLSPRQAFSGIAFANIASTFLGIPLAWIIMLAIELISTGGGAQNLDTPLAVFKATILQAAWLSPYEGLHWRIPVAALVLLIPSFLVTVIVERLVLVKYWKTVDRARITKTVWLVNCASYAVLGLFICVWLGFTL